MSEIIEVYKHNCKNCDYVWKSFMIPKECPNCKTRNWDKKTETEEQK